jgi:hypothetical protein
VIISNLEGGLAYAITVTPIGKVDSNSTKSIVVAIPPAIPTNLIVMQSGVSNIRVSWAESLIGLQYRVAILTPGEVSRTVVTNKSSIEIEVTPGREYEVLLVAVGAGEKISKPVETKIKVAPLVVKPAVTAKIMPLVSVFYGVKKFLPGIATQRVLRRFIPILKSSMVVTCVSYTPIGRNTVAGRSLARKQAANTCSYLAKAKKIKQYVSLVRSISEAPKGVKIPKGYTRTDLFLVI